MVKSPPLVSIPPPLEPYCNTPVLFAALPVLETPCIPWHALELSPPPVTVKVWLESPLCTSCSLDWLTPPSPLLLNGLLLLLLLNGLLLLLLFHQFGLLLLLGLLLFHQ